MSGINIIAAVGKNLVLGKENKLIWKIPGDLPRFKAITTGHPIIMGRKTFDSFGSKPLPNRTNIIITRNPDLKIEGCVVVPSIEEAISEAKKLDEEIFIIGGEQIYKLGLPLSDKLYMTEIDAEADGDAFFPNYSEFNKIISKEDHETPEGIKFSYVIRGK